jgi:hypothetical protein
MSKELVEAQSEPILPDGFQELFDEIKAADTALSDGDRNKALIGIRRIHSAMTLIKDLAKNKKLFAEEIKK